MVEDTIYVCKESFPVFTEDMNGYYEVVEGTEWLLVPASNDYTDYTLETMEEDYATQIYMEKKDIDSHFNLKEEEKNDE